MRRREPTLEALGTDPGLRRMWQRARERIEALGGDISGRTISLPDPTEPERRAIELLLGSRKRGRGLRVSLEELDRALRDSRLGKGLIEVLADVGGPLRNRPAERARAEAEARALWSDAAGHEALRRHPALGGWLEGLRRSGHLLRAAGNDGRRLLRRCLDVLAVLPAEGVGRAVLACELFGNAHALDDRKPVARLLLLALAHLEGAPVPDRTESRRALLSRFGIISDDLSSTVLVLNLRPLPAGAATRAAGTFADGGMPATLSLQMLHADTWRWCGHRPIWVCENQTVLGVAARKLGSGCPPMVCVQGKPSVAAQKLLASLREAAVELRYHGDFDAEGIQIGNLVIGRLGAEPWRFRREDYRSALVKAPGGLGELTSVPAAKWDPELSDEMQEHRREVHEEQVVELLLSDLEAASG